MIFVTSKSQNTSASTPDWRAVVTELIRFMSPPNSEKVLHQAAVVCCRNTNRGAKVVV